MNVKENSLLEIFLSSSSSKVDIKIKMNIEKGICTEFYQLTKLNSTAKINELYNKYDFNRIKMDLDKILDKVGTDNNVRSNNFLMYHNDTNKRNKENSIGNELSRLSKLNEYETYGNKKEITEKIIEKKIYKNYSLYNKQMANSVIGNVIDFEVPLKKKRSNMGGQIDLISIKNNILYLVELKRLKKGNSSEKLFRAIVEILSYERILSKFKCNFLTELKNIHGINPNGIEKAVLGPRKMFEEDKMSCKLAQSYGIKLWIIDEKEDAPNYTREVNGIREIVFDIKEKI